MKIPKSIPVYGDLSHRDKNCRQESTEQKEFFGFLKELHPNLFAIAIHPKNEGKRSFKQAQIDLEQGSLNKGASDIIIPCRMPFVCEIKRADHTTSKIIKPQISYLEAAISEGCFGCVALGSNGALMALEDWIKNYKK